MQRNAINVLFRDVLTLALFGWATVASLTLLHVNPKTSEEKQKAAIVLPGQLMVELKWDDSYDTDVDLWVQAPGDIPVGYSNLNGFIFNLLRDDLGKTADIWALNYENAFTRGLAAGEYVVNVHLYGNKQGVYPIKIQAAVTERFGGEGPDKDTSKVIATANDELKFIGQEVTLIRFKLDTDGHLVPGSVNHVYKALRSTPPTSQANGHGE